MLHTLPPQSLTFLETVCSSEESAPRYIFSLRLIETVYLNYFRTHDDTEFRGKTHHTIPAVVLRRYVHCMHLTRGGWAANSRMHPQFH